MLDLVKKQLAAKSTCANTCISAINPQYLVAEKINPAEVTLVAVFL